MDGKQFKEIVDIIKHFEAETGFDRKDFVMVVHPKSYVVTPDAIGRSYEVIAGVEIITNETLDETCMGLISREHLDDLDNVIIELGLDEPVSIGQIKIIIEDEDDDDFDDEDMEIIEAVQCGTCGHPVSICLSDEMETVTCPWCKQKTEIE